MGAGPFPAHCDCVRSRLGTTGRVWLGSGLPGPARRCWQAPSPAATAMAHPVQNPGLQVHNQVQGSWGQGGCSAPPHPQLPLPWPHHATLGGGSGKLQHHGFCPVCGAPTPALRRFPCALSTGAAHHVGWAEQAESGWSWRLSSIEATGLKKVSPTPATSSAVWCGRSRGCSWMCWEKNSPAGPSSFCSACGAPASVPRCLLSRHFPPYKASQS